MTPFPIAAALGERFKKRMQERRGEKAMADFEDMDEDSKIIYQNSLKAQQYLADFGGQLPPEDERNTIEWDRARDIMEKIQNGTLPKTAMIRIAQQFAEKDLGRGAPPTDVRRQRDEIIERVLMLNRIGAWSSESSVKPPPKPEPVPVVEPAAVPAAAAPAGTGRGATTPASTTPSLPDDLVASAQRRKVFGEPPSVPLVEHGPEEAPTGSAVADVLVPPQNLGETSFAEQYPTSPLTTQSFQRPDELDYPRAPTDAEWDAEAVRTGSPLTVRNGVETPLLPQETMDIEDAAAAQGGEMAARVLESQARQFVASSSADEISRDSRVLNALAQEALRLGLPLPTWYTAQIRPTVPASIAR